MSPPEWLHTHTAAVLTTFAVRPATWGWLSPGHLQLCPAIHLDAVPTQMMERDAPEGGDRMSASDVPGRPLGGLPFAGLFENFLRRWDYRPVTRWFENFITINWNAGDVEIERKVLSDVGSYGLQLSRLLAAVDLLVEEKKLAELTPEQQKVVVRVQDLAAAARDSVADFRGRGPRGSTGRTSRDDEASEQ
jgi:hypothetical protein